MCDYRFRSISLTRPSHRTNWFFQVREGVPDHTWEYHRGLLWHCLLFCVGQQAERTGDGWLNHAVWKVKARSCEPTLGECSM